ncbi:hypothetical protein GCM10009860_00050 [Microbacterium mitrae]|nr:SPOR domain-containing protein [Microbacterium mitrae]
MSNEAPYVDPMADDQYWYNTLTQEVEKGRQSPSPYRLGPFATAAEAADAPAVVKRRSEAWAAEDEADDNWGSASSPAQ